jgi:hypothetical protein
MTDTTQARAILNLLVMAHTHPDAAPGEETVLAAVTAALAALE